MKTRKLTALLLAVCMILGILAGCGGKDTGADNGGTTTPSGDQSSAPAPGSSGPSESADPGQVSGSTSTGGDTYTRKTADGTLIVGLTDTADSFDPSVSFNSVGMQLVYDQILIKDPFTHEITSNIAESWEYTDDCTLVVKFKEGVTFSNGETMTAEDALYSLHRMILTNSRWSTFVDAFNFEKSTADGLTLTLVTDEPFGPIGRTSTRPTRTVQSAKAKRKPRALRR